MHFAIVTVLNLLIWHSHAMEHPANEAADKLAEQLSDRVQTDIPPQATDLDDTTLGKSGQLALHAAPTGLGSVPSSRQGGRSPAVRGVTLRQGRAPRLDTTRRQEEVDSKNRRIAAGYVVLMPFLLAWENGIWNAMKKPETSMTEADQEYVRRIWSFDNSLLGNTAKQLRNEELGKEFGKDVGEDFGKDLGKGLTRELTPQEQLEHSQWDPAQ